MNHHHLHGWIEKKCNNLLLLIRYDHQKCNRKRQNGEGEKNRFYFHPIQSSSLSSNIGMVKIDSFEKLSEKKT